MRTTIIVAALAAIAALSSGPSRAQPLEQRFAFGAPPDVLGNDRVRVRHPPPRVVVRYPARRADRAVRSRQGALRRR